MVQYDGESRWNPGAAAAGLLIYGRRDSNMQLQYLRVGLHFPNHITSVQVVCQACLLGVNVFVILLKRHQRHFSVSNIVIACYV